MQNQARSGPSRVGQKNSCRLHVKAQGPGELPVSWSGMLGGSSGAFSLLLTSALEATYEGMIKRPVQTLVHSGSLDFHGSKKTNELLLFPILCPSSK